MTNLLAAIGVLAISIPVIFLLAIAVTAWRAWWLYPAWGWFLMPLGAPAIPFWHFTALLILIDTIWKQMDIKEDKRKIEWGSVIVHYLWPIAAWALLRWMR